MSEPIKNRYDFVILFDVENGNPNGDPDAGNMPRMDQETGHGLVTDACLKRKIRNYVELVRNEVPGYRIYVKQGVPLNRSDNEAYEAMDVTEKTAKDRKKDDPDLDRKIRDWMCEVDGPWDGLQLAERIIADMNGMQPSAWVTWNIIDFYRDSGFVDPVGNRPEAGSRLDEAAPLWGFGMADFDSEKLHLANKYYFFGQFTRYIRPGDTVIASSDSSLAAYNQDSGDVKIVVVNPSGRDRDYIFDMSEFAGLSARVRVIRTDNLPGGERWKEIHGAARMEGQRLTFTAKDETVTTCVIGE